MPWCYFKIKISFDSSRLLERKRSKKLPWTVRFIEFNICIRYRTFNGAVQNGLRLQKKYWNRHMKQYITGLAEGAD